MSDDDTSTAAILAAMQKSLERMDDKLSSVCADVEELKNNPQRAAQLPGGGSSGQVHSTPQAQGASPPVTPFINEDSLTTQVASRV